MGGTGANTDALAGGHTGVVKSIEAVTSATYTTDTPREQITVFGKDGQVATVQNESTTSTIEIVFHPLETGRIEDATDFVAFVPRDLNSLMVDAGKANPTGTTVDVRGIGKLTCAILTSITAEGSVGALPTITCSFDGTGAAGSATSAGDTGITYDVATAANVALMLASGSGNVCSWAQTASFNWEMPVERLNRLGNALTDAVTYGNPPGTSSISVEGTDSSGAIVEVAFGKFHFKMPHASAVSNVTNNMAVGEVGATYNTTTEGTAQGCTVVWEAETPSAPAGAPGDWGD